ncbi:MAG: peptide chain release factor 1 [Planctomycetota bacterium]|jgi:peptide chain release factor 1
MSEQKDSLLQKLDELEARFVQIDKLISDPDVAADTAKLIALSKEQGKLKNIVAGYRQYKSAVAGIADAGQILADDSADDDFKELAKEEIEELTVTRDKLIEDIQNTLVMADDDAIASIIIEIRSGTGGDEAALFARDLYTMYVRYAETRRWKTEQLSFSATERGGFREVIFSVKGSGAWSQLGYEGGGHRVQRVPETESQGRVHTSAATVAVLPEPEETDIKIEPNEVIEHVCRSSGPGGQSVNKLNSAIKLEHTPTGITVSMQDEKSQHKNRAKAWRILKLRIYDHFESKKRAERDSQRKTMIGSGDRSQKIRTYNFPQNRVTDHRIKLSLYNLDKIMAGDLDQIITALKEHDIKQRLENL